MAKIEWEMQGKQWFGSVSGASCCIVYTGPTRIKRGVPYTYYASIRGEEHGPYVTAAHARRRVSGIVWRAEAQARLDLERATQPKK